MSRINETTHWKKENSAKIEMGLYIIAGNHKSEVVIKSTLYNYTCTSTRKLVIHQEGFSAILAFWSSPQFTRWMNAKNACVDSRICKIYLQEKSSFF